MKPGIHLSNRQWREPQLSDDDKRLLLLMWPGIRAVKLFSYHRLDVWDWLRDNLQPQMWLCRLNHPDDLPSLRTIYDTGYRDVTVELYNEPNNPVEGFTSIDDFRSRYIQAEAYLRAHCPDWRIAFPGLSPLLEPMKWWAACRDLITHADYLCIHLYYSQPGEITQQAWHLDAVRELGKRIIVSEFCYTGGERGNVRPTSELAREYVWASQWLAAEGVDSVYFFLLGSDDERWQKYGEVFNDQMARALGALDLEQSTLDNGGVVVMDQLARILEDMWQRQGVNVNPDDGFFKAAVDKARNDGVFIIPQPSQDGNYTTDISNYRIAYTVPPMWCRLGYWSSVEVGLPPF